MKLLLVYPYPKKAPVGCNPPISILFLAASARDAGHTVKVLDADGSNLSMADIAREAGDFKPDLIGVPAFANTLTSLIKFVDMISRCDPPWKILVGGPHPTAAPQEVMRIVPGADFLLRGEADHSLLELLNCIETGGNLHEVRGLTFRDGDSVITNPDAPVIKDLDALPLPARELLWPGYVNGKYWRIGHRGITDVVISSRGCPYKCNFCSKITRNYRMRSAENVMRELRVIRSMGTKNVHFMDDLFVAHRKRCIEICRMMRDENLGLRFKVRGRVNTVDLELLTELKLAGCKAVVYGLESGSQKVLDAMNKQTTVEGAREAIKVAKKVGLEVYLDVLLGYPGETPGTIAETENFIIETQPTAVSIEVLYPLPSTPVYDQAVLEGTIVGKWGTSESRPYVKLPWLDDHTELYQRGRKIIKRFTRNPTVCFNAMKAVLPGLNMKQFLSMAHYFMKGSVHKGIFLNGKKREQETPKVITGCA